MVANLIQLIGALVIVAGLGFAWLPLGFIAFGVLVFILGVAAEARPAFVGDGN